MTDEADRARSELKDRIYEVIFGYDTPAGRAFDVALLVVIFVSIVAVSLESVNSFESHWRVTLRVIEWVVTGLFTLEYGLRLWVVRRKLSYVLSFFGIVDLLALLPTYLSLVMAGAQSLAVIRVLRLLRVFRVLKLVRFLGEEAALLMAIRASVPKIIVFLGAVLSVAIIMGSIMYVIEGPQRGFSDIPHSIYWAVVTLTTVGYGDITPQTTLGRMLSSALMILGYGLIAVPTGVFSVELARTRSRGPADSRATDDSV